MKMKYACCILYSHDTVIPVRNGGLGVVMKVFIVNKGNSEDLSKPPDNVVLPNRKFESCILVSTINSWGSVSTNVILVILS